MIKKLLYLILLILFASAVSFFMVIVLPFMLYGIAPVEQTIFKGVGSDGTVFISFNDVILRHNNGKETVAEIWIKPIEKTKWFTVKVQPDMKCTLLSAKMGFFQRTNWSTNIIRANHVTVWVSSPEEKMLWERWAQKVEKDYWDYKKAGENKPPESPEVKERPTGKKVIPPV